MWLDVENEVKPHLNITGNGDDAELVPVVLAAEAAIGTRVGPLEPAEVTERVQATSSGTLFLSRWPVAGLVSVTPYGSTALTLDDTIAFDDGIVSYWVGTSSFTSAAGPYTVVYQHGWDAVPDDIKLATLELVRHLWMSQRGAGTARPGPRPMDAAPMPGAAYSLPIRVEQLLEPYRVPRVS